MDSRSRTLQRFRLEAGGFGAGHDLAATDRFASTVLPGLVVPVQHLIPED